MVHEWPLSLFATNGIVEDENDVEAVAGSGEKTDNLPIGDCGSIGSVRLLTLVGRIVRARPVPLVHGSIAIVTGPSGQSPESEPNRTDQLASRLSGTDLWFLPDRQVDWVAAQSSA